jgi:hypothetical protein
MKKLRKGTPINLSGVLREPLKAHQHRRQDTYLKATNFQCRHLPYLGFV